jgi:predicted nucleic acid-binding protein
VRVLVDTSVWSAVLSVGADPNGPAIRQLSRMLGRDDVFLTGLVLQEVLQGFRSEATFRNVARRLQVFPLLQLDRAHYVAAAHVRRACATAGVTASTADCQIAAAAIEHRCAVFTLDRDFERIARHTTLRLVAIA